MTTAAAIDRPVYHSTILELCGIDSYRTQQTKINRRGGLKLSKIMGNFNCRQWEVIIVVDHYGAAIIIVPQTNSP